MSRIVKGNFTGSLLFALSLILFPAINYAQLTTEKATHPPVFEGMRIDTSKIKVNDLNVNLVKYSYGKPGINFLAIHDDEDTGVKAAFEYIRFSGGSIVDCQYGSVRNFKFINDGEEFQTDPNSIYTKKGIPLGIAKFGPVDDDVVNMLYKTGTAILKLYNPEQHGYIFTLHNNGDGGFGVTSYMKGSDLEKAADSVHINANADPDDLILVTELKLFNKLKQANVNVVLQSADAPDDGSLSVYAHREKIPYINVEVQHGHIEEHLQLIEVAIKALYECYPEIKQKATN